MSRAVLDEAARRRLRDLLGDRVRFDEPMVRHTTFRIGGPADALAEPADEAQLRELLQWSARRGWGYTVIGGGSNLLVLDGGIRGLTIRLTGLSARTTWKIEAEQVNLTASAGVPTKRLCALALRQGWAGLNFALGIPGSLGGALSMNAGTIEGAMADIVESVRVMTPSGDIAVVKSDRLEFGYRLMRWPAGMAADPRRSAILLGAELRLTVGDAEALRSQARQWIRQRTRKQPSTLPSAGCFFRNPAPDRSAGRLIDEVGLKGRRHGGAEIATRHANFIVNRGGATAADVLALAALIEKIVAERFGVKLEREVRIIGDAESGE